MYGVEIDEKLVEGVSSGYQFLIFLWRNLIIVTKQQKRITYLFRRYQTE